MELKVKLNVTQKILFGYIVGFILLMAFAALTLFNGKKIEATTIVLSQEKIPGLIAAASLKSNVQLQTNQLYELYATNDLTTFSKQRQASIADMLQEVAKLSALAEYKPYQKSLMGLGAKQAILTDNFVRIMSAPEVDWDGAREALAAFSQSADAMGDELDNMVNRVSTNTLSSAKVSQKLTEQLISLAIVLAGLIFLGVIAMAYYSHRQVAVPLREISEVLGGIVARKDLTYRIKYRSDDEIGRIALDTNNLLEEFQKLARTLDGTAQEVNRATNQLTEITESAKLNMVNRNSKLRTATQIFMGEIEASTRAKNIAKEVDLELHRAQMKFVQTHLKEIDDGSQTADHSVNALKTSTIKLQKLAENMQGQIKLLNF
jgi:methyl-accepting chemotaxis protein